MKSTSSALLSVASGRFGGPVRALVASLGVVAVIAVVAGSAGAQATVTHAPDTQEFGIDAGATIGLGSQSSIDLALPAARARIGFFLNDNSRWSIEPAAFLGYSKVEGLPSAFVYDLEGGALYHFSPPASLYSGRRRAVAYVRPFVALSGTHSGGSTNNEFSAGGGLGIKVPWRPDVAFRFEGNLGYGFSNKAARLGLFAGLSFFSRDLIPTP